MSISRRVVQFGQRRLARRILRVAPWIGGILALATLGNSIRRKGAIGGTLDTTLDFLPIVGGVKNAVEIVRGRDLIRDRRML